MSTVDPYATHDRDHDRDTDEPAAASSASPADPRSPYAYPSPFSGEQAGEPIDLHPYETGSTQSGSTQSGSTQSGSTQSGSTQSGSTQSGSTVLDLTEPVAMLHSEPRFHQPAEQPVERPRVPGPDATTWPPRTPFPDEEPPDRRERDDRRSFAASTRGLGEEAARLASRLESPETKVFYKTSEFALTIVASVILMVAAAASSTFDADQLWPLFTWLIGFYLISRGLAKAGTRQR